MTNVVVVRGRLTRPVGEKVLPSGDRLAVLDLTIPGTVQGDRSTGRAESVPASWIGPPAWLRELDAGAEVVLFGRVRRRFFHSSGLQSRTEVVVEAGAPTRRAAKVAELIARAVETLTAGEAATGDGDPRDRKAATRGAGARDRKAATRDGDARDGRAGTGRRRRVKAPPTFP